MLNEQFEEMTRIYVDICNELNKQNTENSIIYEVLQESDVLAQKNDILYRITEFYNQNWTGNRDFMHIPDFAQVKKNCLNYPIIIAREKGKDNILAIATIKYDENSENRTNPYYPETGKRYFSITGALVKHSSPYKGLGRKIYEIAIKGIQEYNSKNPGVVIMCEIDCRNNRSMNALNNAIRQISYKNDKSISANLVGYYLLLNKEQQLIEAPTFIFEVDFSEREQREEFGNLEIKYKNPNSILNGMLFDELKKSIEERLEPHNIAEPTIGCDGEDTVQYYPLREALSLDRLTIIPNDTDKGNDRIPVKLESSAQHPSECYISLRELTKAVLMQGPVSSVQDWFGQLIQKRKGIGIGD